MSPSTSSSTKAPLPEPRPLRALPRQSTAGTLLLLSALLLAFFPSQFISASRLPFDLVRQSSILWAQPRPRPSPSADGAMSTSSATTAAAAAAPAGGWFQTTFTLPPRARGSYLVTSHVESTLGSEIAKYRVGILHLFVQHTSCALSLNENWDDDVRADMSDALDRIVPEAGKASGVSYRHSAEGRDDMPAHIKSALIGSSVSIPISDGRLATGTWQGIWYLEFRAVKHTRRVVATINGERR